MCNAGPVQVLRAGRFTSGIHGTGHEELSRSPAARLSSAERQEPMGIGKLVSGVKNAAEKARRAAEEAARRAAREAARKAAAAQKAAEQAAAAAAKQATEAARERARDTFTGAKDKVAGGVNKAEQVGRAVGTQATDQVRHVQQAAADVKVKAQEGVERVKGTYDTFEQATGVAGTAKKLVSLGNEAKVELDALRRAAPRTLPAGLSNGIERAGSALDKGVDALKNSRVAGAAADVARGIENTQLGQLGKVHEGVKGAVGYGKGLVDAGLDVANAARDLNPENLASAARSVKGAVGSLSAEGRQALQGNLHKLHEGLERVAPGAAAKLDPVQRVATAAAGEAVEKIGGSAAAKLAAKAGGRFVPGANVAMAGLDVAVAASTQRDPNASGVDKGLAWATAAGSVVSASNIPVVSQIGAGASVATEALNAFL
jgi:hypothetical protein